MHVTLLNWSRAALIALPLAAGSLVYAQQNATPEDLSEAQQALRRALAESKEAETRGLKLEAEARAATEAAKRTANEAAALAARIQQAEAGIAAAEARIALIGGERAKLSRRLAERREPLVRLTGALQKLARRPLAISALRPGSLRETVYLRAMLESTIPQVRKRTASLRSQIEQGRALEQEANQALAALRQSESQLATRQKQLAAIEARQKLASRQANSDADRENERALALAEEAIDLDNLVDRLGEAGGLRKELAALPGPIIRPEQPQAALVDAGSPIPANSTPASRLVFQLPVTGRTISGFGATGPAGIRNTGISLIPRDGAQVIAPAQGRVAFAGPYRGYERIVILEHPGGWTSLVTGLARTDVNVGEQLVAGAPLGVAGVDSPLVTLELRRDGTPVNPLEFLR